MSYSSRTRKTIVVANSPVSFAVMGAGEPHRQVLIRSHDPNLDLVGLDNRSFLSDVEKDAYQTTGALAGFLIPDPRSFVVRTSTDYGQTVSDTDSRTSHLSFAWRGLADRNDLEQIEHTFSMLAADLMIALEEETGESAEWQIAPMIALCRSKTDARLRRSKRRRAALIFTFTVYGAILLAFAFNFAFFVDGARSTSVVEKPRTAAQP